MEKTSSACLEADGKGGIRIGRPASAYACAWTTSQATRSLAKSVTAEYEWRRGWDSQSPPRKGAGTCAGRCRRLRVACPRQADADIDGGEGGIRTHEPGFARLPAFEAGSFNRSDTSPR